MKKLFSTSLLILAGMLLLLGGCKEDELSLIHISEPTRQA